MADEKAPEVEQEVAGAIDALKSEEAGEGSPDSGDETLDKKETPTLDVEGLARKMRWTSKDEFQGHEEDYVDAETFILRGQDIQESMKKHLKENKKKLGAMDRAIKDIKIHYDNNAKSEASRNQKRLIELRKERDAAIEEADKDAVDAVESEMADLYESASRSTEREDDPQEDPEQMSDFVDWHKDNSWYRLKGMKTGNAEMTKYADKISELPENKALPYERQLKVVADIVKEKYPENFKPTTRTTQATNTVESPSSTTKTRKYSARDLTNEQRSVMKNLVDFGDMTEREYIDDLVKIGDLK